MITFDNAKYYFNVGENTTRAILQSRRGWKKAKGIFLSQLNSRTTSGIAGELTVSCGV
jgi:ribonuclease Z